MGPLMRDRTVVLVTHHVELVLPGAQFLVRMLDGRIDLQGTLKDLRASGALSDIELEAAIEERAEAEERVADGKEDEEIEEAIVNGDGETVDKKKKKPRKLVKDEEREEGNVKWAIYKTYLKAS
jgi:ABC-type multidrug transport system ATPase subunit